MASIQKNYSTYFTILIFIMGANSHVLEATTSVGGLFSIANDPMGHFVGVWGDIVFGIPVIKSATLSPGEDWSEPVVISNQGSFSSNPQVVMDDLGNAIAIWLTVTKDHPDYFIEAAMLPLGGTWGTPVTISDLNEIIATNEIELEISEDGSVVAIWGTIIEETTFRNKKVIRAAMTKFGESWSPPVTVSNPTAF